MKAMTARPIGTLFITALVCQFIFTSYGSIATSREISVNDLNRLVAATSSRDHGERLQAISELT